MPVFFLPLTAISNIGGYKSEALSLDLVFYFSSNRVEILPNKIHTLIENIYFYSITVKIITEPNFLVTTNTNGVGFFIYK